MIIHVYNPERILNANSSFKSVKQPTIVSNKAPLNAVKNQDPNVIRPPPSPKLLRQSVFKGFNSKVSENRDPPPQPPPDPPCVPAKKLIKSREVMDSDEGGLLPPPWASRGLPATPSLTQMACTCHCNSAEPVSLSPPSQVSSSNSSGRAAEHQQQLREASTASSHYFTPVSSFSATSNAQNDDSKEPDSLEYRPVRDSPPTRKTSLDRILSPQVSRRSPQYTSSPAQTGGLSLPLRDKSLSPVVAVPLTTSMSNASIQSAHSGYSEDSLMAGQHQQRFGNHHNCQQCIASEFAGATPAAPRWNNINYDSHSGHWIPETGLCMAVEKRPIAVQSSAVAQSTALLDFSKDSLNSSGALERNVTGPQQAAPSRQQHVAAVEEVGEEEDGTSSCTETVKLEPLAFTIDFGDVIPGKKKEAPPKRFAERLAAASSGGLGKRATPPSKAEVKKSESGAVTEPSENKMLKSLSNRLGSQLTSPLSKFNTSPEIETVETPRRSPAVTKSIKSTNPNRNSSVGRTCEVTKPNGLKKKPQELVRRSPSPTPPPSPMKSSNRTTYLNGSNRTASHATGRELKHQQSIDSDEGGYDYHHQEAMMGVTGSGRQPEAVRDSEIAAETVEEEEEDRCDDAASETGTYTIGKDSPSPDEDQSRRDIDRVFGLLPSVSISAQSETSAGVGTAGQIDPIDNSNRSTPQWIREWAAQVAQQQEAPLSHLVNIPAIPANLAKPPSHPRPPPPELPTAQRPRRRLPSVPPGASNGSSRSRSSPRPSDMSDPSDSSLETESFLRDTESVVSAMQARVDGRSSTESDAETRSSSSYRQSVHSSAVPAELENSRKLSAQLRAKIRSLDEQYPVTSTTATPLAPIRKTTYVMTANNSTNNAMNTSTTTSTTTNIIHNELHGDDAKSLHSDSSLSDFTSGETSSRSRHAHEDNKTPKNVPAVRYNRALSLRRGRLGLDVERNSSASLSGAGSSVPNKDHHRRPNDSPSRGSSPQVPAASTAPLVRKLSSISTNSQMSATSTSSARGPPPNASSNSFSRNDGGRFSLRLGSKTEKTGSATASTFKPKVNKSQSGNIPPPQPQQVMASPPQPPHVSGARKSRSNSTLSSKEAEFQNWKRRKNYDPMKAAAEGKKKEAARRAQTTTLTMSQSMIGTVTSMASSPSSQSPSPPPRTIIRSASFTCVNNTKARSSGMDAGGQQSKYNNNSRRTQHHKPVSMHNSALLYSSDDENDMLYSPPKKASPKPSPMTTRKYMGLNLMQTTSHNSPPSLPADFSDLASVMSNDVDLTSSPGSPRRKLYLEDSLLMRTSASNSSLRARTKLEALDNLVISTIYGMSAKIRSNAESLMRKLRPQYVDDLERLGLIDDALNRLSDCASESPIHSVTAGRSSSRELSGTLKVMKRVEQVFQALDQVLFEDVLDGGGEEGAILNDGTTTEGEDWNGYTSGDFY
ncbi:mucin-5AC-like isoform X2 [Daphnia carinata]|uniref:mucin-5AC-like isoform X2 n=1 Tax=Daphnia carinata TaxID=120202 RepID=UPI002579E8C2|nr:mucin-5AC-like isoform X2 [Daphnia carinata]